jgi:hypothetical protein
VNTGIINRSPERQPDSQVALQQRLRLTAALSVSVSLLGALVLLLTLCLLFRSQPGQTYYQIIQSLTLGQDRLFMAMTLAGSVIVLLAGLVTWVITLYSSHRIAGPFYRFAKNLELEIERGPVTPVRLRKDDRFQMLAARFTRAADGLETYYASQRQLIDELARSLDAGDADGIARSRDLLRRLAAKASGLS